MAKKKDIIKNILSQLDNIQTSFEQLYSEGYIFVLDVQILNNRIEELINIIKKI